jgi:hypothetical protein
MEALLGLIKAFSVTGVGQERASEQSEMWKQRPTGLFASDGISFLPFSNPGHLIPLNP